MQKSLKGSNKKKKKKEKKNEDCRRAILSF